MTGEARGRPSQWVKWVANPRPEHDVKRFLTASRGGIQIPAQFAAVGDRRAGGGIWQRQPSQLSLRDARKGVRKRSVEVPATGTVWMLRRGKSQGRFLGPVRTRLTDGLEPPGRLISRCRSSDRPASKGKLLALKE